MQRHLIPLATDRGVAMIHSLIDEAIALAEQSDLNCHPGKVPLNMRTGRTEDDWVYWMAIPSTANDLELREVEERLGTSFSPQYREVLQYKHFIELQIGEVSFFRHPSDSWKEVLFKNVFGGYPKELLIEKGYLPFADYSDWGLWCFAVNEANESGEYPIYLWDHERPEEFKLVADDLASGLQCERENTVSE